MPRLQATVSTRLPIDEAFAYVADFANAPGWDPGTVTSERIDDGPPGLGAAYRLGVRMGGRVAPMTYRVVSWEPPVRVVLRGSGSGVEAVDEIRFAATPAGTDIDYTADLRLTGWKRLLSPVAGGTFRRIAADAAAGMRQALDARAAGASR